jgi:hypothetical protein
MLGISVDAGITVGGTVGSKDGIQDGEYGSVDKIDGGLLGMPVGESDSCNFLTFSRFG